jgi:hypothetical protein
VAVQGLIFGGETAFYGAPSKQGLSGSWTLCGGISWELFPFAFENRDLEDQDSYEGKERFDSVGIVCGFLLLRSTKLLNGMINDQWPFGCLSIVQEVSPIDS